MANFEISSNPEYTEQIRKFEPKDPAHADLFNSVIGALLNNDVFLKAAIDSAFRQGTGYTDQQIAELINGAPSTLDTLGEIAEAMKDNVDVVQALNQAIGTKASQAEVDGHIDNGTIHITASERQNWNDKQTKTGDVQNNIVTFESGDTVEPTGWANVAIVTTKEKLSSLMRKFSLTVKNVRYLFKLIGNTQLSVGDGTITGAINELNTGLAAMCRAHQSNTIPITDGYIPLKLSYNIAENIFELSESGVLIKPGIYIIEGHFHFMSSPNDLVEINLELFGDDQSSDKIYKTVCSPITAQILDQIVCVKRVNMVSRALMHFKSNTGASSVFTIAQTSANYLVIKKIG